MPCLCVNDKFLCCAVLPAGVKHIFAIGPLTERANWGGDVLDEKTVVRGGMGCGYGVNPHD